MSALVFPGGARNYHSSWSQCVLTLLFIAECCPRLVDLLLIFGTVEAIVSALKIRFAELPVHSKMYYKSYYDQMTAEEILNTIIIGENGELDPSGLQQDRLGMTPLHILACLLSSVLSCINSLWTRVSCQLDCWRCMGGSTTSVCFMGRCTKWDYSVPCQ